MRANYQSAYPQGQMDMGTSNYFTYNAATLASMPNQQLEVSNELHMPLSCLAHLPFLPPRHGIPHSSDLTANCDNSLVADDSVCASLLHPAVCNAARLERQLFIHGGSLNERQAEGPRIIMTCEEEERVLQLWHSNLESDASISKDLVFKLLGLSWLQSVSLFSLTCNFHVQRTGQAWFMFPPSDDVNLIMLFAGSYWSLKMLGKMMLNDSVSEIWTSWFVMNNISS